MAPLPVMVTVTLPELVQVPVRLQLPASQRLLPAGVVRVPAMVRLPPTVRVEPLALSVPTCTHRLPLAVTAVERVTPTPLTVRWLKGLVAVRPGVVPLNSTVEVPAEKIAAVSSQPPATKRVRGFPLE